MPEDPVKPGRVLAGRYRLEERLGEGGMGAIWRAEHMVLSAPVAVKILTRDVTDSEEAVARFLREAKAAASLRSVHVVQILDYGVDEGVPFIAMELLEGETLRERLKRKGALPAEEMARIVAEVSRAVGRAHDAGIVHRDLKPENIFLVTEDDNEITKVLDFGVAKVAASTLGPDATKTRTGSLLGTPYYMSPEQAQGNKEVDHRSDLWSLGVIAFECVTGRRPFTSDALGDLVLAICVRDIPVPSEHAAVPTGFDAWFARATARAPDERFQSAREMIEALRDSLGDDYRLTIATTPEEGRRSPARASEPEPTIDPRRGSPGRAAAKGDEPTVDAGPAESATSTDGTARASSGRAGLDDTVLATPDHVEASLAGATTAADEQPRSLVFVVGVAALIAGLSAGAWMVWSQQRKDDDRPLPTVVLSSAGAAPSADQPEPASPDAGDDASTSATPVPDLAMPDDRAEQEDAGQPDDASADANVAEDAELADALIEAAASELGELEAGPPEPEPEPAPYDPADEEAERVYPSDPGP